MTSVVAGSPRERLLAAASELFYDEGVHTVGIDRVIGRAGVAKATLYSAFGSKDGLVQAYLEGRQAAIRQRVTEGLSRYATPRERLLGVFEIQSETFGTPRFRGCAFLGATAESRAGSTADAMTKEYRRWLQGLFAQLATEAGAADPARLARQLRMIYDGASYSAWVDGNHDAGDEARSAASTLLDSAP